MRVIIIIVIIIVITLDNSLTIITAVKLILSTFLLFFFVVRTRLSIGRILRFAPLPRVVFRAPGHQSHRIRHRHGQQINQHKTVGQSGAWSRQGNGNGKGKRTRAERKKGTPLILNVGWKNANVSTHSWPSLSQTLTHTHTQTHTRQKVCRQPGQRSSG